MSLGLSPRWLRFTGAIVCAAALLMSAGPAAAGDLDEFRIKRADAAEFARRPAVSRQGDRIEIRFATTAACDVTVAIEDAQGRILRHLASGVLGPNAPAPLKADSLEQTVVWDGKDEQGRYVDAGGVKVRVSLGLRARFEKALFYSPKKRISRASRPVVQPCAQGVLVFEGEGRDVLRLFSHEGEYVRTLYPFAADKLDQVLGLAQAKFPQDGRLLPLKHGLVQATLLTSGSNVGDHSTAKYGSAASAMAEHDGKIALAMLKLNRLHLDGGSGGLPLEGPQTSLTGRLNGYSRNGEAAVPPRSVAFSADGKYLYLTGYGWDRGYPAGMDWLNVVMRLEYASDKPMEVFVGSTREREQGDDATHLRIPTSVAVDKAGRVYVSDMFNDRIQVFSPDAKLVKSIPIFRPTKVAVHPTTGEIWVGSWYQACRTVKNEAPIPARLTRLGPVDDPKVLGQWPIEFVGYHEREGLRYNGLAFNIDFDWHAQPMTIWQTPGKAGTAEKLLMLRGEGAGPWEAVCLKLLTIDGEQLALRRDFGKEVAAAVTRAIPPVIARQRLYVNPKNHKLYVAEGDAGVMKSFQQLVEIDPDSGRIRLVNLPFDAEDMAFDINGLMYLRTDSELVRYDPSNFREVPWDYGEERKSVGFSASGDGRRSPATASLILPSRRPGCFHQGGLFVAADGDVAVSCHNIEVRMGNNPGVNGDIWDRLNADGGRKYVPPAYPGRVRYGEVHIWDKHGRKTREDVAAGLPLVDGIAIDRDDNLYVMAAANRVLDGQEYFLERAETLMKFPPNGGKLLSSSKSAPVPLDARPAREPDLAKGLLGQGWVEGASWMYGGVGFGGFNSAKGGGGCACWNARFALDYFGRSFAPEVDHFSVAVLDSNGNLIMRIGQYGNEDSGGPGSVAPVGGDEVGLFHAAYVAADSDRRLFIADAGNSRIVSVKLDYRTSETLSLPAAGQ